MSSRGSSRRRMPEPKIVVAHRSPPCHRAAAARDRRARCSDSRCTGTCCPRGRSESRRRTAWGWFAAARATPGSSRACRTRIAARACSRRPPAADAARRRRARPSMVVIAAPSAWTARQVHDSRRRRRAGPCMRRTGSCRSRPWSRSAPPRSRMKCTSKRAWLDLALVAAAVDREADWDFHRTTSNLQKTAAWNCLDDS